MYVLFDIGGSKTRVAVSRDGSDCQEPVIVQTPKVFEKGIETLVKTAQGLLNGEEPTAIGGGIAGPIDKEKGAVVNSANLSEWNEKPLAKILSAEFKGVPVYLENDAMIVGLGEAIRGAGRGFPIVAYVTISTGVGGALIIDGEPAKSAMGFEIGKQIIDIDHSFCTRCELPSTLEHLVSGKSVLKRTGKDPRELTQDDPLWEELAQILAIGLGNTIMHWSPHVVVLGGSMITGSPYIAIDHVRKHLEETLTIFPKHAEIKKAECGIVGGIYGALEFAKKEQAKRS